MSKVQPNAKVIAGSLLVGSIVIYALYATWNTSKDHIVELEAHFQLGHDHHDHSEHEHGHAHGHGAKSIKSWKTSEFKAIPDEMQKKRDTIEVIERHTEIELKGKTLQIFSRQTSVMGQDKQFQILLLHGMRFSSKNWDEIKTIHLLAAMGYRVVAVDLPGFGNSKNAKLDNKDKAAFLTAFIARENLGKPLIVSPSMSGSFALPYLMGDEPDTCSKRAAAYIPVAPVGSEEYSDADYKQCQIPVMVVYGQDDTKIGVSSMQNLRQFDISEIFTIKNAGHACYLDDPKEWSRLLYNFVNAVDRYMGR